MTKASDNIFPKVTFVEGSAPSSPSASDFHLYVDSSDHLLKYKNSAGVATTLGAGIADQGVFTYFDGTVGSAPSTPASGKLRVYAKTGKVLAVKDDTGAETVLGAGGGGSDLVQTDSGAGSVYFPGLRGHPDAKPASPNAKDDEFDALSGWSTLGTVDVSNVTDSPSYWHAERTPGATNEANGLYKAIPSMPFTVTMRLNAAASASGNSAVGLMLLDSTPTALFSLTAVANTGFGGPFYDFLSAQWSSRTSRGTSVDHALSAGVLYDDFPRYIRMKVNSSSSIDLSYSVNGFTYVSVATGVATGLTVANFGIFIGCTGSSGLVKAYVDWIRVS